jgi:cellulose synthase/poly-beta-1,6-N-acetylglucosamine synthase-like glycosyltransferase/peptidoglycan/xylan/chitin deacetylase (PgdA/CDA1 family)
VANKPIFFDASGRRAARTSYLAWAVAIFSTVLGIYVFISIVHADRPKVLPLQDRYSMVQLPNLEKKALKPGLLKAAAKLATQARARRIHIRMLRRAHNNGPSRVLPGILNPQAQRSLAIAFYTNWNEASYPALKRALPVLDWVIPTWLTLSGPNLIFKGNLDRKSLDYIRLTKPGVAILPLLQNATFSNGTTVWNGLGLQQLLADPVRRTDLENKIVNFIAGHKLQGVAIDFENVPKAAQANLKILLADLSRDFAPHKWVLVQCAPFDDASWPYGAYADIVDYTILMAYDQHDESDPPGSIAGQDWYEKTLDKRMRVLSPDSTIIAIGSYAYDWVNGGPAYDLGFQDAIIAARDSGATINFDPATDNPHFSYTETNHDTHDVWFLDGVTGFNEIHAADPYRPAGYALWRLGPEDPSILSVLGRPYDAPAPEALHHIVTNDDIDFDGDGEILRVEANPTEGRRSLDIDSDTGDIDSETYTRLPTNYLIRRVGVASHKLALTFDDGPSPEWTPQILDVLQRKHATATFFVIGSNVEANPGLVQRELADGYEIGNHTFTHPDLGDMSDRSVRLELNATQRLFEALTGRSLRLFRPPYLGDASPTDAYEILPMETAQSLGYITVGEKIDTLDWTLPSVDKMLKSVLSQLSGPNPGNIILMHDAGGNRARTVALLPRLIDTLRARGYQLVPVSTLAGFTRNQAMPHLPFTLSLLADRVVFMTLSYLGRFLYLCFLGAIILGFARLLALCGLSIVDYWQTRRQPAPPLGDSTFLVSVVIPAFNEEKVIGETVARILASDYVNLNVLVIDDGSKDRTAAIVRERFNGDPRVTLITVPNGGKANALNAGLQHAKSDVVVALDADTQFANDTISRLVRWFDDPTIGAVAGNAKVGNRINTITRWQALEYIVSQNLERRALAALDTLTVVPGAVGAWRRETLVKLGGFPSDTLAEDQDLTIAVQTMGYRVHFDSTAVAWTEAPTTVRGLAKQRFRWAYGTLQCLWKYRHITFNYRNGALGLVALPQVWLFQILLTALAPVADLLLVWQLVGQWLSYQHHGAEFNSGNLETVGIYYAVFMAVDLIAAGFGFLMEKGEDWSLLWWLMLQRFGYRQLMYYVVVRSITTAIRGPLVGWGKPERTGTVKAGGAHQPSP